MPNRIINIIIVILKTPILELRVLRIRITIITPIQIEQELIRQLMINQSFSVIHI